MKHKGERHIPDFSNARKTTPRGATPDPKDPKAARLAPRPNAAQTALPKPHGTSSKSGRRGQ